MPAVFKAKDRNKREHVARVDRVMWPPRGEDGDSVILKLLDGASAIGPGTRDQFETGGQQFRFLGRWVDGRFGDEFKFETFAYDVPHSRAAVVKYLSDTAEGVGTKTAERLFDKYGPDAVRQLREEPDAVAAAGIMSADNARAAAADLARFAALEQTRIDLFGLFAGRGFHGTAINRAIGFWGVKAPDVIRRDPFAPLVKKLPGAGFKRCDKMFIDLGGKSAAPKRQAISAWAAIRDDRTGSTWIDARDIAAEVTKAIPRADPYRALRVLSRAGWIRVHRDGRDRFVTLRERADHERRIADAVRALSSGPSLWPATIPTSSTDGDGLPSAHQAAELARAMAGPLGCFTGGPGTGKTFTLAAAVSAIIAQHGRDAVSACAPTGKAAVRSQEAFKARGLVINATTIHRLLEIGKNGRDGGGWGFKRNRTNPLDCRFLFVDEPSMIDAGLMADLLDACAPPMLLPATPELVIPAGRPIPPKCLRCGRELTDPASWAIGYGPTCAGYVDPSDYVALHPQFADRETRIPARPEVRTAGTHVLLVGDPYQLPPVGHGAPLRDLIAGGVPTGELTEVRRNSGAIVRACAAMKAGTPVEFPDRFDLDAADPLNLRLLECQADESVEVLGELLAGMKRFDARWECQIITGLNDKSDVSRAKINERFGRILNPDGAEAKGNRFRVGDKIICARNTELKAVELPRDARGWHQIVAGDATRYEESAAEPIYTANGELGRVVAVSERHTVARFGAIDAPLVRFTNAKPKKDEEAGQEDGAAADFDLAWAITVHRSQGSEWPCVVVMIDDAAAGIADRNWWYTAASRARTACVLIGPRGTFDKQVTRVTVDKRRTFLPQLLRELSQPRAEEAAPCPESSN